MYNFKILFKRLITKFIQSIQGFKIYYNANDYDYTYLIFIFIPSLLRF